MQLMISGTRRALVLPSFWEHLRSLPQDPPGTQVVGFQDEQCEAIVTIAPLHGPPMPFDQAAMIQAIRSALAQSGTALVEVTAGRSTTGEPFVLTIVKIRMEPSGVQYNLTLHRLLDAAPYQVQGFFTERGMTGGRDAMVLELMRREGAVTMADGVLSGWFRDPYDPAIAQGFLSNRSDEVRFDGMFPGHPLSRLRDVIRAAVSIA